LLGLAVAGAGLAKGPAAWPVIGAALVGASVARGSWRAANRLPIWLALAIALGVWGYVYWRMSGAIRASGQTPVMQGPSEFLWAWSKLSAPGVLKVASMPIVALVSALPASLGLLLMWDRGVDAVRTGSGEDPGERAAFAAGRAIAIACVGSLAFMAVLGVDNPRYAMPSVCVTPMLVGGVVRGMEGRSSPWGRRSAQRLLLSPTGRGLGWWPIVLTIAAGVWAAWGEPRSRAGSGWLAGEAMAREIAASGRRNATVLADHVIEARPEILWYAQRQRAAQVCGRWIPGLADRVMPTALDSGTLVLLRTDAESGELARAHANWPGASDGGLVPIARGSVSKFDFTLFGWRGEVSGAEGPSDARPENSAKDAPE
jgi:hypothetical protein